MSTVNLIVLLLFVDNIFGFPWITLKCEKIEDSEWPEVGNLSTCFSVNLNVPDPDDFLMYIETNEKTIMGLSLQGNQLEYEYVVFPSVIALSVTYSNILTLDSDSLRYIRNNLKVLNMSHNLIDEVSARVFDYPHLSTLKVLDLSSNLISKLPDGIFEELKHLRILNLSSNMLVRFTPDYLPKNDVIREFYINDNEIEYFPSILLSHSYLYQCQIIDLSRNKCIIDGKYDSSKHKVKKFLALLKKVVNKCSIPMK